MAALPASTSRKFNPADYKGAPDWFVGRFLSNLNLFTDPVYTSLLNGLTFAKNMNAQIYNLAVTANASMGVLTTASFTSSISGTPSGLILVGQNYQSDPTIPLASPITFSWYASGTTVNLTGIAGLTPSAKYFLKFLVIQ